MVKVERLITRFLGEQMAQTPKSLNVWEDLLAGYDFKRIIDIGTYKGFHSLYLLLYCLNRIDARLYTYDPKKKWGGSPLMNLMNFGEYYKKWDVFQHIEEIGKIIQEDGISIVFCDGNEKSKELNTFAPFLKVGDVIGQHDWNTYYSKPEDTAETREKYHLVEVLGKQCDEEGYLRFFVKSE